MKPELYIVKDNNRVYISNQRLEPKTLKCVSHDVLNECRYQNGCIKKCNECQRFVDK